VIFAGHALCPAISLHGGELKRSQIPQGDKTLHFDTIWIGKARMAVEVEFFLMSTACWTCLCVK